MFDQSYQQLYVQKQVISLAETYPCPRCKGGHMEPFGETETFLCNGCNRKFVAINAGRILYPAQHLQMKIAPVFWWDGLHWHLAGTTASAGQSVFTTVAFIAPIVAINIFILMLNHGHLGWSTHGLNQSFFLNLGLLNILLAFFMAQLFYLFCWDQNWSSKRHTRQHNKQVGH